MSAEMEEQCHVCGYGQCRLCGKDSVSCVGRTVSAVWAGQYQLYRKNSASRVKTAQASNSTATNGRARGGPQHSQITVCNESAFIIADIYIYIYIYIHIYMEVCCDVR